MRPRLLTGLLSAHAALMAAAAALDAEQVHVSVRSPRSVTVSWVSPGDQTAEVVIEKAHPSDGAQQYRSIRPNTSRYQVLCGSRYKRSCVTQSVYRSPLLLHADADVEPSTQYRYRVGGGPWRRLRTPPAPGARELRLAVVGDLGQTANSAKTCRDLRRAHQAEALDAAVLLGDLAYADTNASRWDSFGRLFDRAGCSEVPWLTIPGNHEIEPDDLSGEPFVAYRARWRPPEGHQGQVAPDAKVVNWRSYNLHTRFDFGSSFFGLRLGCVHLIALNPYTDSREVSTQIRWLRREVTRIDRNVTPHVMVVTHAPWRHSSKIHQARNELATSRLRHSAGPLLAQARVDMMFSGHVHAYERSRPISGVRHFVVGHGGNFEGLYNRWNPWSLSAFRAGDHYGWGILHLRPTVATWHARRSHDGAVVDSAQWAPRVNDTVPGGAGGPPPALAPVPSGRGSKSSPDDRGSHLAGAAALLIAVVLGCFCWQRVRNRLVAAAGPEERAGFKDDEPAVLGATELS